MPVNGWRVGGARSRAQTGFMNSVGGSSHESRRRRPSIPPGRSFNRSGAVLSSLLVRRFCSAELFRREGWPSVQRGRLLGRAPASSLLAVSLGCSRLRCLARRGCRSDLRPLVSPARRGHSGRRRLRAAGRRSCGLASPASVQTSTRSAAHRQRHDHIAAAPTANVSTRQRAGGGASDHRLSTGHRGTERECDKYRDRRQGRLSLRFRRSNCRRQLVSVGVPRDDSPITFIHPFVADR